MKKLDLSQQELDDISEAIASADTKPRFARKLLALKMLADGLKRADICSALDVTRATTSATSMPKS